MEYLAYRLTTDRPIDGRMRAKGETVHLTSGEYEDEARWGGLELDVPEKAASAAPEAAPSTTAEADADDMAATPARTRRKV